MVDEELVEIQDTSSVVCRLRHWTPFPRWGRLGLRPPKQCDKSFGCGRPTTSRSASHVAPTAKKFKKYCKNLKKPLDKPCKLWYTMSVNEAEPPLSPSRDRGEIWLITRKSTGSQGHWVYFLCVRDASASAFFFLHGVRGVSRRRN